MTVLEANAIGEYEVRRATQKQRIGRYLVSGQRLPKERFRKMEDVTFKGETVLGVPVSTYHQSLVFGVFMRTERGLKLMSKHATLTGAMNWRKS